MRFRFTIHLRAGLKKTEAAQRVLSAVERPVLLRDEDSRWRALRLLAKSADGHTEPYLFAVASAKPCSLACSETASRPGAKHALESNGLLTSFA